MNEGSKPKSMGYKQYAIHAGHEHNMVLLDNKTVEITKNDKNPGRAGDEGGRLALEGVGARAGGLQGGQAG